MMVLRWVRGGLKTSEALLMQGDGAGHDSVYLSPEGEGLPPASREV
jgi:hypothetical protein